MDIYLFKVKDYTTVLVGQYDEVEKQFFVQRGDGEKYRYDDYRIVWSKKVVEVDVEKLNLVK